MNKKYARRPHFYEGQYLGADDFNDLHSYLNDKQRRHALGMHTWGIVAGLELTEKSVGGDTLVYLQPGYAVDGYGRSISVLTPCQISPELFCAESCGLAKVWLRLKEVGRIENRPGFTTCCERDCFERIDEMFEIAVGAKAYLDERHSGIDVAGNHLEDPREVLSIGSENAPLVCDASVSYQQFPNTDGQPYWYIPIGMVRWDGSKLQARSAGDLIMSRAFRRQAGLVGESLFASNGLLRLRARTSPTESDDAGTVCNALAIDADDVTGTGGSLAFNELVWIEGDLRITGDARLFGTRLEFRKTDGDDGDTPLYIRRGASNSTDLEVTLGKDDANQTARLVVGTKTGNGSDIEGKFFVTAAGRVGIGTGKPSTSLHIAEGSDVTLEDDAGYLLLGKGTGRNLVLDDNEIQARNQGDASTLHLQLEGGDTNISNATLYVKNDTVGIGTNSPNATLDVRGDIRFGDNGNLHIVGSTQGNLVIVAGLIEKDGTSGTTRITPSRVEEGEYTIMFTEPFNNVPAVTVSPVSEGDENKDNILTIRDLTPGGFKVFVRDVTRHQIGENEVRPKDEEFTFIAIGMR